MSYQKTLEKAGAKVLEFKEFGSYQGEWWAKVEFNNQIGWVNGAYGSCSGCDAFEAELGFESDQCDEHRYTLFKGNCDNCRIVSDNLEARYIKFGLSYLHNIMSQEEAEQKVSQNQAYWDNDDREMKEFILKNR